MNILIVKKAFFILSFVLVTILIKGQTTIGSKEKATYGAILDLKDKQAGTVASVGDDANITSTTGGMLLPRVKLDVLNMGSLNTVVENGDDLSTSGKLKLTGLMVYNIQQVASQLYLGIYIWNGYVWTFLRDSKVTSPISLKTAPKAFSFYETDLVPVEDLIFEVNSPKAADGSLGTVTYQWYQMVGSNINASVENLIPGATNANYQPTRAFKTTNGYKSTNYAQNNGLSTFFCIAKGSDGSTLRSDNVEVAVGCGAKNNLGQWVSFMCFNLGARNGITIKEQLEYPMGTFPTTVNGLSSTHDYKPGEEDIWGDMYQWGRIADGHEKRNSLEGQMTGDGSAYASSIGSGYYCKRNGAGTLLNPTYPYYQIKPSATDFYGKFIKSTQAMSYNWFPAAASVNSSIDNLWQSGRFIPNDPCAKYLANGSMVPTWTVNEVPTGANAISGDPACAESNTSWRMPTSEEMGSIYVSGKISGYPPYAKSNTFVWFSGGATNYISGIEIRPDGETTTLYLPCNGRRDPASALLRFAKDAGLYWTVDYLGKDGVSTMFNSAGYYPAATGYSRGYGLGVRCIKQD